VENANDAKTVIFTHAEYALHTHVATENLANKLKLPNYVTIIS